MKIIRLPSQSHRLAAAVALALAAHAGAATDTWVGNLSPNWNALNWTGGNNPPLPADLLVFGLAGSAGTSLNNDLAALFAINGITFNASASAYTFGGNALTLAGNVTNNSVNAQVINLDLAVAAQRTITTATGGGNVTLGGIVSGAGGLAKAGAGTLFLTGAASTYTGETVFGLSGIVNVATFSDYGVAGSLGARTAAAEIPAGSIGLRFTGGTLQYTGATAQSTNREIRLANNATNTIDASGSDPAATLRFTHVGANTNLFETAGHRTLNLTGTNTGENRFAIRLTDQAPSANPATTAAGGLTNLTKAGPGTWFITNSDNTYQGETTMAGGILNVASVSDYGVASSIGTRAAVGVNTANVFSGGDGTNSTGIGLIFRGGTLQYTGSTPQSTNRNIRLLNGNSGAIDASGSNPGATFSFTHTGANTNLFAVVGTRTLTLTGTNTGDNGFAVQLLNQGGNATSLTKTGTGNWLLNGPDANVNTGTTTVNNGTLSLGKTNAIAVNAGLVIGDGVNSAAVRIDNSGTGGNQIADATVPSFNGPGALRLNNRAETIGGLSSSGGAGFVENESGAAGTGTLTVNVTGSQDFSGTLRNGDGAGADGTLAFTKIGAGTQILSGANTHTGAATVNGGTLTVDGSLAAGSAVAIGNTGTLNGAGTINGPVTIGNGGAVGGTGIFTNVVSVASGGTLGGDATFTGAVGTVGGARLSPGSATTPGTLTFTTLTLATGALVDLEFGGASDRLDVLGVGGLALNGGSFNIFESGGVTPLLTNGPRTLLAYNTSFTGSIANLSIANAQPGKFYSLADDTANDLIVLTIGDATVSVWNGAAGNGLWTTGGPAGNWSGAAAPNAPGAVAKFGTPGAPTVVAVDGAKTVGGIIFDSASAYTINGPAAITLDNGIAAAGITVSASSHRINAPLVLATNALATTAPGTTLTLAGNISGAKSFTAAGGGITIFTGTNSYTTTSITGGTLQIGDNTATGTLGSGDVSVTRAARGRPC